MPEVTKIPVGSLETNCYILADGGRAVMIDPGDNAEGLLSVLKDKKLALEAILLTHAHYDHVGAVAALREATGARVYMHEGDKPMIGSTEHSLAFLRRTEPVPFTCDVFVNDGDILELGAAVLKVFHTPGHSAGGVCYAMDGAVFCGDLIFKGCIGRYDFGNYSDEMASVKRILDSFPDETVLLPGHGEHTSVGYEKKTNPYIRN